MDSDIFIEAKYKNQHERQNRIFSANQNRIKTGKQKTFLAPKSFFIVENNGNLFIPDFILQNKKKNKNIEAIYQTSLSYSESNKSFKNKKKHETTRHFISRYFNH